MANDGSRSPPRVATAALPAGQADQYADGKAAAVWNLYVGSSQARTKIYRENICKLLRSHNCHHVLDVACGTGIDSVMLLEEGFMVTSIDFSDKMLKHAHKLRWSRRKEDAFDTWVIEEGNWLTLLDTDIDFPEDGFDAVVCLGNSFAHLPDNDGSQDLHRVALKNFRQAIKPGGVVLVDHRNYDAIIDSGRAPSGANIYYNSPYMRELKTSVVRIDNTPSSVTLNYTLQVPARLLRRPRAKGKRVPSECHSPSGSFDGDIEPMESSTFELSYYPHRLDEFSALLKDSFSGCLASHKVLGDFSELSDDYVPGYYIHVAEKTAIEPSSKVPCPT